MCDLKGLCNTVSAGERLRCPKSSHQVLWNNTSPLAVATWDQHHCTRCGVDITHEQEHTHIDKCTSMAWGSLGQGGGLQCTWLSAGGHFSTAHPIRGEWWYSGEVGCWRPLQSGTGFYQPAPRAQPLPLKKYSANYLGALLHNKTVDCTDPDYCWMRKLQRRFHLCTNTVTFQQQSRDYCSEQQRRKRHKARERK